MLDSRCGVLGVEDLTFSHPVILLLIMAKQLHFCLILCVFFFFVPVITSKIQSSFKVLGLDQEILSNATASQLMLM